MPNIICAVAITFGCITSALLFAVTNNTAFCLAPFALISLATLIAAVTWSLANR